MSKTKRHDGRALNYTNGTGAAIASGTVLQIGALLAVAETDIADGATGAVGIVGVYEVPKLAGAALAQGERVELDAGAFKAAAAGAGVVAEDAVAADTTALVLLNA